MHSFLILPNVVIEQLLCNSTNSVSLFRNCPRKCPCKKHKSISFESGLLAIAIEAHCKVLPHDIIDVLPVLVLYFSSIIY